MEAVLEKRRLKRRFDSGELRRLFTARTHDEMFARLGRAIIGVERAKAIQQEAPHLLVWEGYEYVSTP